MARGLTVSDTPLPQSHPRRPVSPVTKRPRLEDTMLSHTSLASPSEDTGNHVGVSLCLPGPSHQAMPSGPTSRVLHSYTTAVLIYCHIAQLLV